MSLSRKKKNPLLQYLGPETVAKIVEDK